MRNLDQPSSYFHEDELVLDSWLSVFDVAAYIAGDRRRQELNWDRLRVCITFRVRQAMTLLSHLRPFVGTEMTMVREQSQLVLNIQSPAKGPESRERRGEGRRAGPSTKSARQAGHQSLG